MIHNTISTSKVPSMLDTMMTPGLSRRALRQNCGALLPMVLFVLQTTVRTSMASFVGVETTKFSSHGWYDRPYRQHRRILLLDTLASEVPVMTTERSTPPVVALTREDGKNDKLHNALNGYFQSINEDNRIPFNIVEIPCIQHAAGSDYPALRDIVTDRQSSPTPLSSYHYIIITSPEAARVLASVWKDQEGQRWPTGDNTMLQKDPLVAAVGKATEAELEAAGIAVSFCPTKATAEVLVQELPFPPTSSNPRVLYPASAQAPTTLQDGLEKRGFQVHRLNTYDTVSAEWTSEQQEWARQTSIVSFASPSAVKGWVENSKASESNQDGQRNIWAACIGETSAKACRKYGWPEEMILCPEYPGIEGWVQTIVKASEQLHLTNEKR